MFILRTGSHYFAPSKQHKTVHCSVLNIAPGQAFQRTFATSPSSAGSNRGRPVRAFPFLQAKPLAPTQPAHGVDKKPAFKTVNLSAAHLSAAQRGKGPAVKSQENVKRTTPAQGAANSLRKSDTTASPTSAPVDAAADRRQRSFAGNASTSAAAFSSLNNGPPHTTAGINQPQPQASSAARNVMRDHTTNISQLQVPYAEQAPAYSNGTGHSGEPHGLMQEPSQYAHKEAKFDVAASMKQGSNAIRDLLETQKIVLQEYAPGQKPKTRCPRCNGGTQHEDSLAVHISVDSQSAAWLCHRATCGWDGKIDQKAGTS